MMNLTISEIKGVLTASKHYMAVYATVKLLAEDALEARAEMERLRNIEQEEPKPDESDEERG